MWPSRGGGTGDHGIAAERSAVVGAALLLVLLAAAVAAAAETFTDAGFASDVVASLPAFTPVGLAFAPDGRIFVWQKSGIVRIVSKAGTLLERPFLDIQNEVNQFGDRGLLGLALDPNFATNGFVYLLYTVEDGGDPNDSGEKTSRLSRVTASGDLAVAGSERTLLDGIPSNSSSHSIGTIRFAPDGTLFLGSGDGADFASTDVLALRAQDLSSLNGKILRINADGSAAQDNPFSDGTNSIRSRIWAYGLRNPFRFTLHPTTGEPVMADVGWNAWEEVNVGRGANFGWPCFEGDGPQPGYQAAFPQCGELAAADVTAPLYTYDHFSPDVFGVSGTTIIGGPIYTGSQYPVQYHGSLFIADYTAQWIKRIVFDDEGQLVRVAPFATGIDGPVDIEQGPDGLLYYVALNSGQVRRIRFNGAIAVASATPPIFGPTFGYSPLEVKFSSDGSQPAGGLTYSWDFGDGSPTSSEENPTHTYTAAGVQPFTATLTVRDSAGRTSSDSVRVTVGSLPPVPTISAPKNGLVVFPGQTVTYHGSATDPDEGALGDAALSWVVLLHHNTHVHVLQTTTGPQASFGVTDHGVGTFSYEIILTARDSSGLTQDTSITLPANPDHLPFPTALTFSPSPVTSGNAFTGTVKMSAPAPAGGAAVTLSSDAAAVHVPAVVTVPAGARTATFVGGTSAVVTATPATVTATLNGLVSSRVSALPPTTTATTPMSYADRGQLLADWDFLARTAAGGLRDTEQRTGNVVSFDPVAGVVHLPADAGDVWQDSNDTRNTLFRDLPAEWTSLRLRIKNFAPVSNWQAACLLAYQDDDDYFVVCRDFADGQIFEVWHETAGTPATIAKIPNPATSGLILRIDRDRGTDTLTGSFSTDNGASWIEIGSALHPLANPRVGIFAGGNASSTSLPVASVSAVDVVTAGSPPAALAVSPGSLSFSAQSSASAISIRGVCRSGARGPCNGAPLRIVPSGPALQKLSVTRTGGAPIRWSAFADQPWVTLTPTSGTTTGSVSVGVRPAGLPAGMHSATVTITSLDAGNATRTVPVSVTVGARNAARLTLTAPASVARPAAGTSGSFMARPSTATAIRVPIGGRGGVPTVLRRTGARTLPENWTSVRIETATPEGLTGGPTACVAAYADDTRYVAMCRIGEQFELWHASGEAPVRLASMSQATTGAPWLRLERDPGTATIRASFSSDDGVSWTALGPAVPAPSTPARVMTLVGSRANRILADITSLEILAP